MLCPNPALAIVAPAGSGKTTVLTRRIAHRILSGQTSPSNVLALSFTRAAAYQIGARVSSLIETTPISVGTFHSVALATLRRYSSFVHSPPPKVLEDPKSVLERLVETSSSTVRSILSVRSTNTNKESAAIRCLREISWAKSSQLEPVTYLEAALSQRRLRAQEAEAISLIFESYENYKKKYRLLDMDDLIPYATSCIDHSDAFASIERFLHRHIYVDEFQDANQPQIDLLMTYLGENNHDICVVGDPNQSIYGWNGARSTNMSEFLDTFPEASVVTLSSNFRCGENIVHASGRVMPKINDKRIAYEVSPGRQAGSKGNVILRYAKDEDEETLICAREIQVQHSKGVPYSSMAVLARTNAQLRLVQAALEKMGIAFRGSTSSSSYSYGWYLRRIVSSWQAEEKNRPVSALISEMTENGSGREPPAGLIDQLKTIRRAQPNLTVGDVLEIADDLEPRRDATSTITATTFHGAKGLEWYHVHLIGFDRIPSAASKSSNRQSFAEEQRLAYVAMTRASDSLLITFIESSHLDSATRPPYLEALESALRSDHTDRRAPDPIGLALGELYPFSKEDRLIHNIKTEILKVREKEAKRRAVEPRELISDVGVRTIANRATNVSYEGLTELVGEFITLSPTFKDILLKQISRSLSQLT